MPVLAPIIMAAGSAIGGALSNRGSSSTTPTIDPAYSPLQQRLLNVLTNRLTAPNGSVPPGFETGGIDAINTSFAGTKQAQDADLTRRGLARSPVAATVDATRNLSRAATVGRFRAGVPLIAQQLQTQDLGMANNVLAQGRGINQTTSTGGGPAGAATNLAGMLGYLTANGAFRGTPAAAASAGSPLYNSSAADYPGDAL